MTISQEQIRAYTNQLESEEKTAATVEKYVRSAYRFAAWLGERELSKELVVEYKATLKSAAATVNGVISAVNSLLTFLGHPVWKVKPVKSQRRTYRPKEKNLTKEEYERLIRTAETIGNERLARIVETLGCTGMRVSELRFLTLEALEGREMTICNKGKMRTILLTTDLVRKLKRYCKARGIKSGAVFVSRNGVPLARTQIWAEIKRLCKKAGVDPHKGFPHNLRHLFAVIHYRLHRDLVKLADILGHSNVNTTRIYLLDTGDEHRRQLEAMGMVIQEEPPAREPKAAELYRIGVLYGCSVSPPPTII